MIDSNYNNTEVLADLPEEQASQPNVKVFAARSKEEKLKAQLTTSGRCRLVVVTIEIGGRWSTESISEDNCPSPKPGRCHPSCFSTALAWERRWTRMLSTVCSLSFVASLVEPSDRCETWCWTGGEPPPWSKIRVSRSAC